MMRFQLFYLNIDPVGLELCCDIVCLFSIAEQFPSLVRYCTRMKERFWPDWDEAITHGFTREATA